MRRSVEELPELISAAEERDFRHASGTRRISPAITMSCCCVIEKAGSTRISPQEEAGEEDLFPDPLLLKFRMPLPGGRVGAVWRGLSHPRQPVTRAYRIPMNSEAEGVQEEGGKREAFNANQNNQKSDLDSTQKFG
jgi:hypothetical protein